MPASSPPPSPIPEVTLRANCGPIGTTGGPPSLTERAQQVATWAARAGWDEWTGRREEKFETGRRFALSLSDLSGRPATRPTLGRGGGGRGYGGGVLGVRNGEWTREGSGVELFAVVPGR